MVCSENDFTRGVDFGMLLQRVALAGDFQESDELSLFERMKGAASVLQLDLRTEDMRNEAGAAFKALSRIAHPDKVPGTWKKKAEDTFQLFNAARELLNQRRPGDELERIGVLYKRFGGEDWQLTTWKGWRRGAVRGDSDCRRQAKWLWLRPL